MIRDVPFCGLVKTNLQMRQPTNETSIHNRETYCNRVILMLGLTNSDRAICTRIAL